MYCGVPTTTPTPVSASPVSGRPSASRAIPKSITLRKPGRVHEQVVRLDVPVDDPFLVRHLERAAELLADRQRRRDIEPPGVLNERGQRGAPDQLHRDVVGPVRFAEVVGPHHIAMGDPPRQPELLLEALEHGGAQLLELRPQHLDRHELAELAVHRAVHDAHPAPSEHVFDLVASRE